MKTGSVIQGDAPQAVEAHDRDVVSSLDDPQRDKQSQPEHEEINARTMNIVSARLLVSKNKYLTKLRWRLATHFNEDQLRKLCRDLQVEYDYLPGRRSDKEKQLIAYLKHRGRVHELVEILRKLRPDIPWTDSS